VLGIPIHTAEAEVHLGFLPRLDFEAQRRARRWRRLAAQEALHRRVAAPEAVLLDQELPDRLALDVLGVPGQDLLAERLDQGLLLGRPLHGRRCEQRGQRGRLGQRPRQQPALGGPLPVVRHGVAADLEVARDAARPLSQLQPSQDLSNLGHRTPPSRHAPLLREESDVSEAVSAGRGFNIKQQSGHLPPGGSRCPPLGGSAWATLPGSGWATPGGSACPTPVAHYRATADSREKTSSTNSSTASSAFTPRSYLIPKLRKTHTFGSLDTRNC